MDPSIQKALNDKIYDKRKSGALELESVVREALAAEEHDKIQKIVHQLCHEYAYAVHQPHARNGGLIGLAAASIALGPEVARYLEEIVPPVLACFTDQDARVRYYACESMYNIAKVAKGEILVYFNDVFDALCKLAADTELSVKNGAELLDRLVKDIVSESASSYVSMLRETVESDNEGREDDAAHVDFPTAFSLSKFIPLLEERINVLNPFTRTFLVNWITLLDSIPDLELVTFLPSFLPGLFKFLSDPNKDVHTTTQVCLDRFLAEIKKISRIKRGIAESRKGRGNGKRSLMSSKSGVSSMASDPISPAGEDIQEDILSGDEEGSYTANDEKSVSTESDWIPGQDIHVDHAKILDILVTFLSESSSEELQITSLRWIDTFFDICPEDILPFVPRLLSQVLPAMAHDVEQVRQAANRVNTSLTEYILSLPDDAPRTQTHSAPMAPSSIPTPSTGSSKEAVGVERRESGLSKFSRSTGKESQDKPSAEPPQPSVQYENEDQPRLSSVGLDYEAAVNSLTLQFLNEQEATRVAALQWLIMLHRKSPRKILAINDGIFPALLKTLSDPSDSVVTRDLLLLSQISKGSDDSYFTSFMVNLLKLFATDRRLLETRGNLIIRQLCLSLSPERIYRTMADCLEKDEDIEFASIMIQNLNNNLITAPELADLRRRLRNLDSREGQHFFVALFRSWCHNSVATFSLCLLGQAYEQAYNLLQIFAELEMTVNLLIQIDKLVQLLESPVFTYLRLQLLEPERYPHLYKCLYGLLMLLPQSSAFYALKNRLNSVSAIGYLHIAPRTYVSHNHHSRQKSNTDSVVTLSAPPTPATSNFDRPNRLKTRDDPVRWMDLLEKFKATQERGRKAQRMQGLEDDGLAQGSQPLHDRERRPLADAQAKGAAVRPDSAASISRPPVLAPSQPYQQPAPHSRAKSSLSHLGRFAGGVGGRKSKKT
ncbi:ARM repeat-containing protein [Eremomyces bilateralis CBS 781.70]|uniref:ARM repeat-containing protein n=1 Tax=Eremomyces bilateralis CBS 781.70 TaxID=1392243 RepID=A0A6G1GDN6_9PEZI|nr:ARM repeat-containing protein [Eremomyces bilateralis CBS 781.70]KAF1816158.1 ARM repeat-containing protein [Eremomyces bilateralis CBS 781.70]